MMRHWLLFARLGLTLLVGTMAVIGPGCAKSKTSANPVKIASADSARRQLSSVEAGATTRDTSPSCRRTPKDSDDDDDEGGDGRSGGSSSRGSESAEALVSRLCKGCHGGSSASGGNTASRQFGRRRGQDRIIRSEIKFGGRDDLEVRANDVIREFENPGPQHNSISDPDEVIQVFEALKEAKQRRLDRKANNCI